MGHTDRSIRKLVRSGDWVRLRHGTFTSGETARLADDRRRHELLVHGVLKRAHSDLVISHESAAVVRWNAPLWRLDLTDVQGIRRDSRAGRIEAGVHQHQGVLEPDDIVVTDGIPFTSAARTAIDVTTRAAGGGRARNHQPLPPHGGDDALGAARSLRDHAAATRYPRHWGRPRARPRGRRVVGGDPGVLHLLARWAPVPRAAVRGPAGRAGGGPPRLGVAEPGRLDGGRRQGEVHEAAPPRPGPGRRRLGGEEARGPRPSRHGLALPAHHVGRVSRIPGASSR